MKIGPGRLKMGPTERILAIFLRNRAEYRLFLSRRDHRPSRKSADIRQD